MPLVWSDDQCHLLRALGHVVGAALCLYKNRHIDQSALDEIKQELKRAKLNDDMHSYVLGFAERYSEYCEVEDGTLWNDKRSRPADVAAGDAA